MRPVDAVALHVTHGQQLDCYSRETKAKRLRHPGFLGGLPSKY